MTRVMAVAFEPLGRLYYVDPGGVDYAYGQNVLVSTGDGTEVARCVWGPAEVEWAGKLEACLGPAGGSELQRDAANRVRRAEILSVARRLIARHELSMRVVGVDFVDQSDLFDQQAIIYFEAPGRVDFRLLLADLARALQARIDLRQIGPRDAAAIVGGLGPCGREFCCSVMGPRTDPLPARFARERAVANSPTQSQGSCGRLMCCLAYENDLHVDSRKRAPAAAMQVLGLHDRGGEGHVVPLPAKVNATPSARTGCPLGRGCSPSAAAGRSAGTDAGS